MRERVAVSAKGRQSPHLWQELRSFGRVVPGQPSAVSLGPRTRHDPRRDSSPCTFDSPIQPSAPIYGTSSTAGAALPTRPTMTRSRSSSPTLLPSIRAPRAPPLPRDLASTSPGSRAGAPRLIRVALESMDASSRFPIAAPPCARANSVLPGRGSRPRCRGRAEKRHGV